MRAVGAHAVAVTQASHVCDDGVLANRLELISSVIAVVM